jgi:acyl-CoA synthetase (AMP-forming)/AMP-acid ligase II
MPDAIATSFAGRTRTWREFKDRVSIFGAALRRSGAEPGNPIAILALNSDFYSEYFYGTWWAGCASVPMNTRWSPAENAYALNDSGAKILFCDDAFTSVVAEITAKTNHPLKLVFIGAGECPDGMVRYEDFLATGGEGMTAHDQQGVLAGIFYTGGTTGFPKGVMVSDHAIWFSSLIASKYLNVKPGDNYLHVAPMFHVADGFLANAAVLVGASSYYISAFTPDDVQNAIAEHKITQTMMVPTMIQALLNNPNFSAEKYQSLEYLLYGASPMPEGVLRAAMEKLPHVKLVQGYGQTEMAPIISVLEPDYHVLSGPKSGKLRSAGRPITGIGVRIVDENGCDVPRGTVGEIVASGPNAMLGYWNKPEQTAETSVNGEIFTGDGAYMDEDGFLFIVDRLKDMIVSGGENVFSAEVENAVSTHPDVQAVAVIGVPDEQWGERVHAIIIPVPGKAPDADDIVAHCREQIAGYKCPRSVELRTEPFPLSGAGKVLKTELREPYWKGAERSVN